MFLNIDILKRRLHFKLLFSSGRNNKGRTTVYHRGGGSKKFYRLLNFFFLFKEIPFYFLKEVKDPNRNVNIFLAVYYNGFFGYFLKPLGSKTGDIFVYSNFFIAKIGYFFLLKEIPVGSFIYNIQKAVNNKGAYIRSAGLCGKVLKHFTVVGSKYYGYSLIEMPSKEKKLFLFNLCCAYGKLSNFRYKFLKKIKQVIIDD